MHLKKAGAIIIKKNKSGTKVLLLYRAKQNDWSFPKGHIEPNESPEAAMRREVREETGLEVNVVMPLSDCNYQNSNGDSVTVALFLVTPISEHEVLKPESNSDKLQWFSLATAIKKITHDNLREYLESISKKIKETIVS